MRGQPFSPPFLIPFTEHAVDLIEGGVIGVKVFTVQFILGNAQRIGEATTGEWILRYPLL